MQETQSRRAVGDREGWGGQGGGRAVSELGGTREYLPLIHVHVWQIASQYCDNTPIKKYNLKDRQIEGKNHRRKFWLLFYS